MKKLANASDDELEQVVRTEVVPYLNDLLSYPPGTTAAELAGKLKDRELAGCLEQVEASSYMPGGSSNNRELKAKMLKQLKKVTVLVLMLSLSFNAFAADDKKDAKETKQPATPVVEKEKKAGLDSGKIETTAQALTAYDSGDFRRAADYFRGLINPMEPSASTLYNLGNCYYQLGDWGKALVCFERARRLAPMDSDIFENMNLVRRKLFLPEVGAAKNPLELLLNLRDDLRPDQWMLFIGLGWLLCGLALGLRHYVRYSRWFVPLLVGMVIIVVGLVSVISQYGTTYSCDTAVITGRNVPVYSLPSEKSGKTDLKLRDGEEVQVEERRMDWVRVRADNAEGWIHSSELACLWGDWKTLP
jgi:tetratricopeptide (TPR) repeat protein